MLIFNELIMKNDPVKKTALFPCFYGGVQLPHDKVLRLEDKTFHRKTLSKRTLNTAKLSVTANLIFQYILAFNLIKILGLS